MRSIARLLTASVVCSIVFAGCRGRSERARNESNAAASEVSAGTNDSQTNDSVPGWGAYGGDAEGTRYSRAKIIDSSNVAGLVKAWEIRTGELQHMTTKAPPTGQCSQCHSAQVKLEVTPILADGKLLLSTAFNRVLALDPGSGKELSQARLQA